MAVFEGVYIRSFTVIIYVNPLVFLFSTVLYRGYTEDYLPFMGVLFEVVIYIYINYRWKYYDNEDWVADYGVQGAKCFEVKAGTMCYCIFKHLLLLDEQKCFVGREST